MRNAITQPAEGELKTIEELYGEGGKEGVLGLRFQHKRVGKFDFYKNGIINWKPSVSLKSLD